MHPSSDTTALGRAYGRYGSIPFGIRQDDRLMHLYIIGQTGTGKSTLLQNMIRQDIAAGRGCCLLDPHGDLAEAVAAERSDELIYWDAADPENPYGYNPLTPVSDRYRPLVVSGLIDALRKQWSDAWGVRMEHLLRFALLALMEQPEADMQDILRLFFDKDYRREVVAGITDPQVHDFWTVEFPRMNYKSSGDAIAPIANKLGAFLAHPAIRKALCAPETPLRFRSLMDEGRPLVVNLAKGRIGADLSNVLGGLILSSVANAAYSRQGAPAGARRAFFVYADEFHAFTTAALAGMLSELRKYGVGLVLAHQHIDQLDRSVFEAVLGNAGSVVCFRLGASDAPVMARQLGDVTAPDLVAQENHTAFVRLMFDGQKSRPFTAFLYGPGGTGPAPFS